MGDKDSAKETVTINGAEVTVPLLRHDEGLYLRVHQAEGTFGEATFDVASNVDGSIIVNVKEGDDRGQFIVSIHDVMKRVVEAWKASR